MIKVLKKKCSKYYNTDNACQRFSLIRDFNQIKNNEKFSRTLMKHLLSN